MNILYYLFLFRLFDIGSTLFLLENGSVEANSVVQILMENVGVRAYLVLNLIVSFLVILLFRKYWNRNVVQLIALIFTIGNALVVLNNTFCMVVFLFV